MSYTSSPLLVRADTPVLECVRLMKEQNIGSVLVVSDDAEQTLVGIFTERDLLRKVELIQSGGYWENPIRTVMSSPVKTIEVSKLEMAAKIMLQGNFRHLPVVTKRDGEKERVIGIISMRDLFRTLVAKQEKGEAKKEPAHGQATKLRVSLITADAYFAQFIDRIFSSVLGVTVKHLTIGSDYGRKRVTLIFDIDGYSKDVWPGRLQAMNHDPAIGLIVVAVDPAVHPPELMKVLEKLATSGKFWIFKKPLEVFDLLNRVSGKEP